MPEEGGESLPCLQSNYRNNKHDSHSAVSYFNFVTILTFVFDCIIAQLWRTKLLLYFLCWEPPKTWLLRAGTARMTTACFYIMASNWNNSVVGVVPRPRTEGFEVRIPARARYCPHFQASRSTLGTCPTFNSKVISGKVAEAWSTDDSDDCWQFGQSEPTGLPALQTAA
jgi:hypothetical protein